MSKPKSYSITFYIMKERYSLGYILTCNCSFPSEPQHTLVLRYYCCQKTGHSPRYIKIKNAMLCT